MRKLTQDEYIEKCIEAHSDKYDYSLVKYNGLSKKIKIICKEHGIFEQNSKNHRDGQGCPRCYAPNYNITKDEFISKYSRPNYDYSLIPGIIKMLSEIFIRNLDNNILYKQQAQHHKNGIRPTKMVSNSIINRLKIIHNNKFDYIIDAETVYATSKIKIINNETQDVFLYRVDRHLEGMSPNKVTPNLFRIKSTKIHNAKYDYSLINDIKSNSDKVNIICREHGIFNQRVSNHMNLGDGCPKCVGVGKWNTKLLIEEFKKIHLDNFDYSLVEFKNIDVKVKIICKEHGIFEQNIHKHLKGQGCQLCSNNSKGEEFVKSHLEDMNIKYIRQKYFETLRYVNPLSFDFYLPELNTCIEFDGQQHYKPVKWFGGKAGFELTLKRDECKNKWCVENNIKLIRIKYNEIDEISTIIKKLLLKSAPVQSVFSICL